MRRIGLVSLSVGVILAIGGMWGCADSSASGTLGPAIADDLRAAAGVDPLSTTKLTVCHVGGSAGNPTFTPITLSPSGALAHIAADGTPRIGHELDYYATERTPCPPPSTPGTLKVCKTAASDGLLGTRVPDGYPFTFTVASQQYTVPSAGCVDVGEFRVGTRVDIQETLITGASVTSITFDPVGAGTGTPALAAAAVIIGIGETTVTFANLLPHPELWVCAVTNPGVTATSFQLWNYSEDRSGVFAGGVYAGSCELVGNPRFGEVRIVEVSIPDGVQATATYSGLGSMTELAPGSWRVVAGPGRHQVTVKYSVSL
jgi:hypothetical protein